MNSNGLRNLIAAALLALPAALAAEEFVSVPTVLTVHGLNPAAISCDPGSVANVVHNEACYAAASVFRKMGDPENFDDTYLETDLRRFCGEGCAQITAFHWGGDIKTSRASVDRLKDEIRAQYASAKSKGAPFIIIAHSWGTALTMEALAEMDGDGTAGDLVVHKLVTLGSPLDSNLYSLAINGLIPGQKFYTDTKRASFVRRWENYHTGRDFISGKVKKADANIVIDSAPKYADAERRLGDIMMLGGTPGWEEAAAQASKDLENFSLGNGTMIWHAAYFSNGSLRLESLGETLSIDAADELWPRYFLIE
jgi:pimeloyl-ACP methyl ester carboxylesterase